MPEASILLHMVILNCCPEFPWAIVLVLADELIMQIDCSGHHDAHHHLLRLDPLHEIVIIHRGGGIDQGTISFLHALDNAYMVIRCEEAPHADVPLGVGFL